MSIKKTFSLSSLTPSLFPGGEDKGKGGNKFNPHF
jgi:hypothetical protein